MPFSLPPWSLLLIGLSLGILTTSLAAWWGVRRHLRKLRDAQRRARAAERMAEIGSMTSGLAHEIKNPLSTIGLNAQLIAEGLDELETSDERRTSLARRIASLSREAERLRGILQDFLQFAGEPRLERRDTDLNALVSELADFFAPECATRGIRLRIDLSPSPLSALIDPAHIKQAVLNLMLNAVQAMDRAAPPTHPAPSAVPRELILRTSASQEPGHPSIRVHIIDTGPGMDTATQARLFQPYFTTKSGGTGLGLATARRLIEAHEGRIDVHSEPGKGTEFVVVLPKEP